MIARVIYSFVHNCKKGWQFGESQCHFNIRAMLGLMLTLNILAVLMLVAGKSTALKWVFFSKTDHPFMMLVYPAVIFLLLTIFYPLRKINRLSLNDEDQKRYRTFWVVYLLFSMVLMVFAGVVS